jgi:putative transposase
MSQSATGMSLKRAGRVIKGMMNHLPEGWTDAKEAGRVALRRTVEEAMARQVRRHLTETLGRGTPDRRNGSYRRYLLTALGGIELLVPRTRRFSAVSVVQAYARRTQDVDRAILACFVLGLSTRKVGAALLSLFGERVSPATVSRVAKVLDQEVAAFHQRRLSDRYSVLQFDGVVLSRKTGLGAQRRPVLVALGILPDGRKEIIDFLLAPAESQAAWEGLLNDLYRRGLRGKGVELITIDGCPGLAAALSVVYPRARVQRCWAHKVRNILDPVRVRDREEMKRGLRRIYGARSRLRACHQIIRFGHRWDSRYPAAVRCLVKDLEELLAFFDFGDPDWRRAVRTTNAIERRFREVRRRTRPMGVFSDRTSIERILYAVFSHLNHEQGVATPFPLTQNS